MSRQDRQLPTGTVTFLFTDIERSTQTVASVGDERYAEMQEAHRGALREAFAAHQGVEVQTEGDAFFVAFQRATDALDGAVAGQRALEDQPLRVRMGLHTGDALVRERDYVGHEVHRAKRICDAGHGRQILLSETTANLVGRTDLLDLGLHRLKDLGEPQRIYQVGRDRFPALRSLESFTHSLPLQRSAFIGRETEIAEVRALLETNRIVTLSGVGGCGKTRLALQVGAEELDRFPDGVFMVNLAPISDPDAVLQEVATAVSAPVTGGGFLNSGPSSVDEVLFTYLQSRHVLLILDNCEHLIDACAEIADTILARCPSVTILATSREGLRVEGEQTWTVPSLSLPDDASDVEASEAVGLFTARAASVRPGFTLTAENTPPIVEVCRRLDGIPLAIEFAAARVTHLSPRQIAERLDDRFRLLTGGQRRVQRQHTLHAALDWSYDLLDEQEQSLLRRLAVFSGHFSVEAVEAICTDDAVPTDVVTDILGSLVLKSLVDTADLGDEVRYRLLETVRAYAAERLAHAGEALTFRERFRDFYLEWLESFSWEMTNFDVGFADRCQIEARNLLACLEMCEAEGRLDLAARMFARLFSAWRTVWAPGPERYRWGTTLIEAAPDVDVDVRVTCLLATAWSGQFGDPRTAAEFGERAVAEAEHASPTVRSFALVLSALTTGLHAQFTRDTALAETAHERIDVALELASGSPMLEATTYLGRTYLLVYATRFEEALENARLSISRWKAGEVDLFARAMSVNLAALAHATGDDDTARRALIEAQPYLARESNFGDVAGDARGIGIETATVTAVRATIEPPETIRDEIRALREIERRSALPGLLSDLVLAAAILDARAGDMFRGAALLSAYRRHTIARGIPPRSPSSWVMYVHYVSEVRRALGPDEARRARAEGEGLSLDDALDVGLVNDPQLQR